MFNLVKSSKALLTLTAWNDALLNAGGLTIYDKDYLALLDILKEIIDRGYNEIEDFEKQDLSSDPASYFYDNLDITLDKISNCKQSIRLFPEFNPVNKTSITDEA